MEFKDLVFEDSKLKCLGYNKFTLHKFDNGNIISITNGKRARCSNDTFEVFVVDALGNPLISVDGILASQTEDDINKIIKEIEQIK